MSVFSNKEYLITKKRMDSSFPICFLDFKVFLSKPFNLEAVIMNDCLQFVPHQQYSLTRAIAVSYIKQQVDYHYPQKF